MKESLWHKVKYDSSIQLIMVLLVKEIHLTFMVFWQKRSYHMILEKQLEQMQIFNYVECSIHVALWPNWF